MLDGARIGLKVDVDTLRGTREGDAIALENSAAGVLVDAGN